MTFWLVAIGTVVGISAIFLIGYLWVSSINPRDDEPAYEDGAP